MLNNLLIVKEICVFLSIKYLFCIIYCPFRNTSNLFNQLDALNEYANNWTIKIILKKNA